MPIKARVVHWHAVAYWKWEVKEEDCGICRQAFDATCPNCKMPGDDCPPVWGTCNHHFHMHCIMKWLAQARSQDRCPLCRQPWEIKKSDETEISRQSRVWPPPESNDEDEDQMNDDDAQRGLRSRLSDSQIASM